MTGCMVPSAEKADWLEHAQGAKSVRICGIFWRLERDLHMRLRREIIDLVRLRFLHDADDIGRVGYITIVQLEGNALLVRIVDEMVDALGVERRRTTLHAVDDISLGEKQFGQIGAILPGCTGDEGYFS